MDDIQSYTDKLRKTYRQSLDVVLPFTTHEAVVYCNDDEFESLLDEKQSVNDLQACIYLLERHIDLQQEIIKGLTDLQELHKFDEEGSEYNIITDKLLTAQNKLAMLRSRTVRCLTKQIQKRCGDASLQLPPWSENTENEMIYDPSGSNSGPHLTTTKNDSPNTVLMKSENLTNTIYDMNSNGFEKTLENNYDFDPNDNVFEEDSKSEISSERSSNAHESEKETYVEDEEEKINVGVLSKMSKESSDAEIYPKSQTSSDEVKKGGKNIVPKSLLINSLRRGNFENNDNHSDFSNSPKNTKKRFVDSHKRDNGVQLFLNVSNFNSDESDGETSRVSTRHILKPVDEKVTIEVLESKSSDVGEVSEKTFDGNTTHEDSNRDEKKASSVVTANTDEDTSERSNSDPEETSSNIKTIKWDPLLKNHNDTQGKPRLNPRSFSTLLVKKILGKVKPISKEEIDDNDNDVINMAGYLEKLPVNQKKATFLRSWRKRYFKILHGKLFYFEDHRAAAPISFIKLGGCQVVEMGGKCLGITEHEDLGERMLVIRCGSWPELQDWRKALENEAKTKVKRQHFELVQQKKQVIIIDLGSSSIKAGFLEDQAWPQVIIPSVYAVNKDDSKNRFYGYEALNPLVRNVSKLVYPLRTPLTIGKHLLDPNDLIGFLEIIFKDLQADPSQYQVLMTTPVNLRDQDKERLVELLLDFFQVAGVYMKSQAILSMYSYSATCGIVVNIGDHIEVIPVEEGYVVESGMSSLPFGGRQITDHFSRLLSSSGYRYFSDVEIYIAEYLKVKTCYVSQDFSKETEFFSESDCLTVDMSEFNLPSGDKLVTVAKERFTAFEGLFKPELWGKDCGSITDMVYDAVMACSIDNRKEMCRNIYLSGATTKIPGFAERLQTELGQKFPSSLVIQVHAAPDRQFAAFIGAAVLASLETFNDLCISRDEYEESGPELLKKWDGV